MDTRKRDPKVIKRVRAVLEHGYLKPTSVRRGRARNDVAAFVRGPDGYDFVRFKSGRWTYSGSAFGFRLDMPDGGRVSYHGQRRYGRVLPVLRALAALKLITAEDAEHVRLQLQALEDERTRASDLRALKRDAARLGVKVTVRAA